MPERMTIICSFLASVWPEQDYQLLPLSGDASFRRYFRVIQQQVPYVLMDAPPTLEDGARFVAVQQALAAQGVRVPAVVAQDLANGLILLEDLGDRLLLAGLNDSSVSHRYQQALALLAPIRQLKATSQGPLPLFDRAFLLREMQLFIDWFCLVHLKLELTDSEQALLATTFHLLADSALEQPQGGMHRDFHARNLMLLPDDSLAVIDFQDMVVGPVSYDAVSLLKDCYLRWPDAVVNQLRDGFFAQLQQSGELGPEWTQQRFAQSFDWMGLQRHIKVCGIFSRLFHRDGKAGYLPDLPRVLAYVADTAALYPQFADFSALLQTKILPRFDEISV